MVKKMTLKDLDKNNTVLIPQSLAIMVCPFLTKIGYNSGYFGWNWEFFKCENLTLITAYRITQKRKKIIKNDEKLTTFINEIQSTVLNNPRLAMNWELKSKIVEKKLTNWLNNYV